MTQKKPLAISVSEKAPLLVISFAGDVTTPTSAQKIEEYIASISDRVTIYGVLNFHDVMTIDNYCVPSLIRLQKAIRDRGGVRICFLNADVKKVLAARGAIRENELSGNIKQALESIRADLAGGKAKS